VKMGEFDGHDGYYNTLFCIDLRCRYTGSYLCKREKGSCRTERSEGSLFYVIVPETG